MTESRVEMVRYLAEIRRRLIIFLIVFIAVFCVLSLYANSLYTFLATPLLKILPHGQKFIATSVFSPFFVPLELTFMVSLLLSMPFFLYQVWAFIVPALYPHEKKVIWIFLLTSILLFYAGIAFAYCVIFPLLFHLVLQNAPQGVMVAPDISQYLDFSLKIFLAFGAIFEVPVATVILIWSGVVTREFFIRARPYVIVSAFVIGMLIAPPDVLSQTCVAIPLWILFEIGIFISRFFKRGENGGR